MPIAAKVTYTFAMSFLLMLFSSLKTKPSRAQTVDNIEQIQNSPSLPSLPPPQDVQPPSEPQRGAPTLQQLPPPSELLKPLQPTLPSDEQFPAIEQIFVVKRFEITGNTVFSEEKLTQELAEFTNKPINFEKLLEARSKIEQLYIDKGYITSGAYIPEQTLTEGVVKIEVVEGTLEDIRISGLRRLKPSYIRSRIANRSSRALNQKDLLEALELLQINPLIQKLQAKLIRGSFPGANVLAIEVTEADSFNTQIILDNSSSPSVGTVRRQVQVNEANLLGLGDGISLAYSNTDGSNTIDATYSLPLNSRNGTLTFSYGNTSADIIEDIFNPLDIESASQNYQLTFRQPLLQTPKEEFALGITASRRNSDISSAVLDEEDIPLFLLSPGADEEGHTRVSALRFFQEWISRGSQQAIAVRSQFSLGTGAFNATVNSTAPDSRFFAWRGQAQWLRLLAPDSLLLIRGDVQLASTTLLASEQFSLGGINSVRGYRQNYLLRDNGALASVELRLPILRVSEWDGILQVTPFVDIGTAWNNSSSRNENDTDTLAAVGFGLRWSQGNNLTAAIEWGIPLVSVDNQTDTLQENGVYFTLQYNLF